MTAPHLSAGHTVAGRYTIRSLIAYTGEVATYHAASQQGQDVVLKLFDPTLGQRADVMSRLERVRAMVVALPRELVVPVIDSGYDVGTSAPFSVAELLRTPSLAQMVQSGPLLPNVVATILHGIARALDAAHAQQLFHHALKPTNIFVGPAPGYAVRIADFGASVVRSTSPTHESYANAAPWWAPEQLQPAAVLGAATDVFASALIAFHAMTGRSYWMSCQSSPPDLPVWQSEVMGQRSPMSQRASELGATVPASVDAVFARALSVNLLDRPRSVSEIANALGAAGSIAGAGGGPKTVALPELSGYQQPGQSAVGQSAVTQQSGNTIVGDASSFMAPGASQASAGYQAASAGEAAAAPTPGLPPYPHPAKKKKKGPLLPVFIGIGAAVVLGGVGLTLLFWGGGGESESIGTPIVAPTASASEQPASEDDDGSEPAGTSTASPDDGVGGGDDGAGGEGSGDDPDENKVEVVITCKPSCDRFFVDGKEIKKLDEKLELAPGKYRIKLVKGGYFQRSDTIEVKAGEKFEDEYVLRKAPRRTPPVPKPCGQFLRPCK